MYRALILLLLCPAAFADFTLGFTYDDEFYVGSLTVDESNPPTWNDWLSLEDYVVMLEEDDEEYELGIFNIYVVESVATCRTGGYGACLPAVSGQYEIYAREVVEETYSADGELLEADDAEPGWDLIATVRDGVVRHYEDDIRVEVE